MHQFNSIEQIRHIKSNIEYYCKTIGQEKLPKIRFLGTVKLHGTNASIRRVDGNITSHSKANELFIGKDHYGFALHISKIPMPILNELFDTIDPNRNQDVTIYGEWIGKGIQSGCAIQQLDKKQFVMFAAAIGPKYLPMVNLNLKEYPDHSLYNILHGEKFVVEIDFDNPSKALDQISVRTKTVDLHCPWGERFGISGIGEGIVWTAIERPSDRKLWFKTKGTSHESARKSNSEKVLIDPEVVDSINACVDVILGPGRLSQGIDYLKDNDILLEMKSMGHFIKWIQMDVYKEEIDVVIANNLEWKMVSKAVSKVSREYFTKLVNVL